MIKILAIGNSFSQDAMFFLNRIGAADDVDIKAVNLYIPGCSLQRHWKNAEKDIQEYLYEENGYTTEKKVSIRQALESNEWTYVVTQQSSGNSGVKETFFPYLEKLDEYIREHAPSAEFLLHQTWAYEKDFKKPQFETYNFDQLKMYEKLSEAYRFSAGKLHLRLIPCGDVVQKMRHVEPFIFEKGGKSLCRDGRHMDYLYGRYLLGAVWYRFLTGNIVLRNAYIPQAPELPEQVCDEEILQILQQKVDEYV